MSIDIANESGVEVDVRELVRLARFALDRMNVHPQAELSIVLVDEQTMAEHHMRWMDEPGPTDVLAFPMDELRPGREGEEPPLGLLGDVVLCPQVAERQAKEAGHTIEDELHLLTIHGILHLLGYDHADPEGHQEMFSLQARLLGEWQPLRRRQPSTGESTDER
ncbi:MAG TPA: rRNA maturation RNase YbeY [Actinopolymorphaceae bacterium]|jgi:probable rRNA maturation factor